jgi:hypothetical protein
MFMRSSEDHNALENVISAQEVIAMIGPVRFFGERIALAVCSLVLLVQALPAAAQAERIQLSGLALLPGDTQVSPAAGTQESPRIAAGGGGYLVVWTDHRSALRPLAALSGGPYLSPDIGSMHDIYAARLDASGALLDTFPILVTQQTQNQGYPSVAWNGQNWLVTWSGESGMACCPNARIFAARVSPAGTVLDPTPIPVATESQVDGWYGPSVASDGTNWAVVYRVWDSSGISELVGKRLAADGTVLDAAARELRHDTWNSSPVHPDLVYAGDEYLLVWTENFPTGSEGAVRGQRLTQTLATTGGLIDLNPYSPTKGKNPRVTTDGSSFFVAWFEDRYFGWAQVFATRVSHAGTVQDPAGIAVTPTSDYAQFTPQVAWDGTRWLVGYHTSDLLVSRVSVAGTLLDASGMVVKAGAGTDCQPAMVARTGGGVRFAWKDSRVGGPNPEDIYSIAASATGTPGAEVCLSLAAPRQTGGRLVAGGGGHLLVFRSQISGRSRIVAQRMGASGVVLDAEPIEVAAGPNLSSPAVAWNGSLFLVTWQDATIPIVYARRLRSDGSFADPAPITIMTAYSPAVAALGDTFLVAGVFDPNPHFSAPRCVRVRGSDGARLDASPFVIPTVFGVAPALTRLGARWLLMWEDHPSHDDPFASVLGTFIAADGSVASIFLATVTEQGTQRSPSLATGRDTAVVAWHDASGGAGKDIRAQRLLPDGTRLDGNGIRVTTAANDQRSPAPAWNGKEFVFCYGDDRNEGTPGIQQMRGDVYASRMDGQGMLLDPDGFAVSRDSIMESDPVAGGSDGTVLLGCSIFEPGKPYASYRIGLRTATPAATTAVDDRGPHSSLRLRVTPNPFGGEAAITFALSRAGTVLAVVRDLQGREVRRLRDGAMPVGTVRLTWDGRDADGIPVASGIFWICVAAEGRTVTVPVARLR